MKTRFKSSFQRDLQSVRDRHLRGRIKQIIEQIEAATDSSEIPNLKRLRGTNNYFRVRIGDYRIGLVIDGATVIFVRVLHRREIYRFFP